MKARLKVFSKIQIVFQHISVLILLLSIALDNTVDGCVPLETRWTGMCRAKCFDTSPKFVELSECNSASIGEVSHRRGGSEIAVRFQSSGITNVSRRAFSSYVVWYLFLHDSFENFEPGAFEGLYVKYLYITNNPNLNSVPSGVFRGVKGLEELHLSDNYLQSVPDGIFQGLTRLENLDFSFNKIKSVPATLFQGLKKLKELSMDGNSISCFPLGLFQPLQSLEELKMNQKVDITGLCAHSFKDVGVNGVGLEVKYYNAKIDRCIVECGSSVEGLKITESNKICDCNSREGCLTCAGDPVQPLITPGDPVQPPIQPAAGGVQAMKAAATWGIILMVTAVMNLVRGFVF